MKTLHMMLEATAALVSCAKLSCSTCWTFNPRTVEPFSLFHCFNHVLCKAQQVYGKLLCLFRPKRTDWWNSWCYRAGVHSSLAKLLWRWTLINPYLFDHTYKLAAVQFPRPPVVRESLWDGWNTKEWLKRWDHSCPNAHSSIECKHVLASFLSCPWSVLAKATNIFRWKWALMLAGWMSPKQSEWSSLLFQWPYFGLSFGFVGIMWEPHLAQRYSVVFQPSIHKFVWVSCRQGSGCKYPHDLKGFDWCKKLETTGSCASIC